MNSTATYKFSISNLLILRNYRHDKYKMNELLILSIISARMTQSFGFEATVVQLNSDRNVDTFPWKPLNVMRSFEHFD